MHPIKEHPSGEMVDKTIEFKEFLQLLKTEADKAMELADCECPFAAEAKMSSIQKHLREATKIVTTVADFYQYYVPKGEEKKLQIESCHAKRNAIDNVPREVAKEFDKLLEQYGAETGKHVYNCTPGYSSAGDFALWLVGKLIKRRGCL